ncbi:glycoside hydrolase family 15 protein, partial [Curtobacterium sp. Csp1]|uniref:glycoside hydrolase family 15 protein n=1 Tax=Curtobacterium sp. Csp1 TaxID=2495429 RepID=UPI0020C7418B
MARLAAPRDRRGPRRRPDHVRHRRGARAAGGASTQYQGDVFGEVLAALHDARELGVEENADSWALQRALLGYVEEHWQEPDNGIWEMRGPRRHFTHSRAMI